MDVPINMTATQEKSNQIKSNQNKSNHNTETNATGFPLHFSSSVLVELPEELESSSSCSSNSFLKHTRHQASTPDLGI
jgi:hypothetical protein